MLPFKFDFQKSDGQILQIYSTQSFSYSRSTFQKFGKKLEGMTRSASPDPLMCVEGKGSKRGGGGAEGEAQGERERGGGGGLGLRERPRVRERGGGGLRERPRMRERGGGG